MGHTKPPRVVVDYVSFFPMWWMWDAFSDPRSLAGNGHNRQWGRSIVVAWLNQTCWRPLDERNTNRCFSHILARARFRLLLENKYPQAGVQLLTLGRWCTPLPGYFNLLTASSHFPEALLVSYQAISLLLWLTLLDSRIFPKRGKHKKY